MPAPNTIIPSFDIFGGGISGGDVGDLTDRVTALEGLPKVVDVNARDQELAVFETVNERNAWPGIFDGLRSVTMSGIWAIRQDGAWVTQTRADVLSRVAGSEVYGTLEETDETKTRLETLFSGIDRIFNYRKFPA